VVHNDCTGLSMSHVWEKQSPSLYGEKCVGYGTPSKPGPHSGAAPAPVSGKRRGPRVLTSGPWGKMRGPRCAQGTRGGSRPRVSRRTAPVGAVAIGPDESGGCRPIQP
jgi:hypothetical protein